MRKLTWIALGGFGVAALALMTPRLYTSLKYRVQIHSVAEAPSERVAIVFGAGLRRDGGPTPILYDRVATAAELYHSGKVEFLLLSGDGLSNREPPAMRRAALDLGVPDAALTLDDAGLDTYATCYRARNVFGLTRAVLVTQTFHLPRALFLCDALGMQAQGVSADRRVYRERSLAFWNLREVFATANAWLEVNVTRPAPLLGEPLPVP